METKMKSELKIKDRNDTKVNKTKLEEEIRATINRNCAENTSNTPDFILAEYLMDCLNAFDKATIYRDKLQNPFKIQLKVNGVNNDR
jgi:hypothetical protein